MLTFQWFRYTNVFLYFSVEKGSSIKYVCNWWGDGGHPTWRTAAYRRRCHASFVRTHLHYLFSAFWQYFCLMVSRFIYKNKIQKTVRMIIFLQRNQFLSSWNKLFLLKIIFTNKVSQNTFSFNQMESWVYSIFQYDTYFEKTLCSVAQKIRFTLFFIF